MGTPMDPPSTESLQRGPHSPGLNGSRASEYTRHHVRSLSQPSTMTEYGTATSGLSMVDSARADIAKSSPPYFSPCDLRDDEPEDEPRPRHPLAAQR
eukprot:scaffold29796_cov33-Prasinocladus_malaysianus.AAC.1